MPPKQDDPYEYEATRVPRLDTGIGQSLGYESDAAFLESQRAREAKMAPELREALATYRAFLCRSVLLGETP